MRPTKDSRRFGLRVWSGLAAAILTVLGFSSCATIQPSSTGTDARLRQTANLVDDVKAFGITLGIEPTAALGFSVEKERLKVEQVYRVDGYSVYYRQGNEFADSRSVATIGFAAQPIVRRVMVVLHEDLHGDANFALPWEIEEAIVTPLGSLAAVAYFLQKGDDPNWQNAVESLSEERKLSRELNALASEAEKLFASLPIDDAKQKVLQQLSRYPTYRRQFERQIQGQHPPTVLEAKLSHDLAYYRFFDQIAALAELAPNLKLLIDDLKTLPPEATADRAERFLRDLNSKYSLAAR